MPKTKGAGLLDFFRAIWSEWFTAMSGPLSVPATILALWIENPTAKIALWVTAFICVWAAAYAVWKKEREKVISLEAGKDRSATKSRLQDFYASGSEIALRRIPGDISEQDWAAYVADANKWIIETASWIQNNLGPTGVAKFRASNMSSMMGSGDGINEKHENLRTLMNRYLENVERLMESGSYDKG
jgi:hypothetical protein